MCVPVEHHTTRQPWTVEPYASIHQILAHLAEARFPDTIHSVRFSNFFTHTPQRINPTLIDLFIIQTITLSLRTIPLSTQRLDLTSLQNPISAHYALRIRRCCCMLILTFMRRKSVTVPFHRMYSLSPWYTTPPHILEPSKSEQRKQERKQTAIPLTSSTKRIDSTLIYIAITPDHAARALVMRSVVLDLRVQGLDFGCRDLFVAA